VDVWISPSAVGICPCLPPEKSAEKVKVGVFHEHRVSSATEEVANPTP
jgi:hypothetical protein